MNLKFSEGGFDEKFSKLYEESRLLQCELKFHKRTQETPKEEKEFEVNLSSSDSQHVIFHQISANIPIFIDQ